MIILEGADGTGKTTVANKLCEIFARKFGGTPQQYYRHMSRPPEDFDHVAGYLSGIVPRVQDRFHLGSIVYGKILGGGCYPTARRMHIVQRVLRWQGCFVFILHGDRDFLRKHHESRVDFDEMYSLDQILDANDAYRALTKSDNRGEPWCDAHHDITDGYPTMSELEEVFERWHQRWTM